MRIVAARRAAGPRTVKRGGALMSGTKLIRYDTAVPAVAEAKSVDEAKKIRDHADRRVNVSSARRKAAASDFQQAKTANGKPQFLQIVAEPDTATRGEST